MVTRYPAGIDGYAQIRAVRNMVDEITQNDHNNLRSAVIAIEQTLGINPQGPFGTVVARLNDAYSNIEYHVLGNPPRHLDTVIESPARSGAYHSLSSGTVGSQLQELLNDVNGLLYSGSGSKTFADGYALPASYLRSAVSEIVNEIGGSSGGSKVGQSAFSFYKHDFTGTDVASHILDAGAFIEEQSKFLERAFDSFVVEGMAVSQSGGGPNANVAPGFIASNGRLLYYPGGTLMVAATGTCYVYARIYYGVVTLGVATSVDTCIVLEDPAVILHKFTTSGGAWTNSIDMRRFGVYVNNKNYLSVGNQPIYGYDGYGCDFISLKSAVEYAKALSTSDKKIAPKKIMLASDLDISTTAEASILLDVDGIEIDGCGRKITLSVDAPLFYIEGYNINIHDLQLDVDISSGATTSTGLANINTLSSSTQTLSGINIENCNLTYSGIYAATYFLKIGYASSDINKTTLSSFVNNRALVADAGICFSHIGVTTTDVLINSVISGNNFYQDDFSLYSSTGTAICANASCLVTNNIITGGFSVGISVDNGLGSIISSNKIEGSYIGTAYMGTGVLCQNSFVVNAEMVILGNSILGVRDTGIDTSANMIGIIISKNLIDNSGLVSRFTGILGYGVDDFVIGNNILRIGSYGIVDAKNVLNNVISGDISITTTTAAIKFKTSISNGIASDNILYGISGIGIDCNYNDLFIINGNMLYGQTGATSGISNIRSYSVVSNNLIFNFGQSSGVGIETAINTATTLISNNIISPAAAMTSGISLTGSREIFVFNNIVGTYSGVLSAKGINVNSVGYCVISGNYVYGSGNGTNNALIENPGNNCVIRNNNLHYANNWGILNNGNNVICEGNNITHSFGKSIRSVNKTNLNICGNIITSSGGDAIQLLGASGSFVSNNHILGTDAYGINMAFGSSNSLISNNYIATPVSYGIYLHTGETYYNINGNTLYNIGSGGASAGIGINSGCSGLLIANNFVSVFTGYAFVFSGSQNSVFTGNMCIQPSATSIGMDLTSCANCLLTGNYCVGGASQGGFVIDGSPNISATGNFSKGGFVPNNFRNGIKFDGYTCRYVA